MSAHSRRCAGLVAGMVLLAGTAVIADDTAQSGVLTRDQAKKLQNPVPNSKKSISQGRILFARNCVSCHGADAKAQVDVVANATDLTDPRGYRDGDTPGEMFRSIREGAGDSMPSFKATISPEDAWNLVNYIRSLWPESLRPPVVEEK